MKAALIRTGSGPVQSHMIPGSPRVRLPRHDSFSGGIFSGDTNSPRVSLHFDAINRRKLETPARTIRRALSESDVIQTTASKLSSVGSMKFPVSIPEEEYLSEGEDGGSLNLKRSGFEMAGIWPEIGIPMEELGISGGGFGKGRKSGYGGDGGRGGFGGGNDDRSKIGDYYLEMLKSSPGDPLLLRNYGKYLHEVEKDTVRAEEYYGRAILASPGDGEVLSLYGKLIWETQRDGERAKAYFDQAVQASPNDCTVMGSYAQFMWEAEEDEEEEELSVSPPAMVAAF